MGFCVSCHLQDPALQTQNWQAFLIVMDLAQMVIWIREQTTWLYLQVYQNQYFFFDLWSIAHLWSGFVIFSILLAIHCKYPWLWLFVSLVAYEVAELAMLYFSLHVFYPETIKDQFTDIFVGLSGGIIAYFYASRQVDRKVRFVKVLDFKSMLVALTLSFIWVGHAHFFLMQPAYLSPFSVWLFLWRFLLVYLLFRIYAMLGWKYANLNIRLTLFSLAYCLLFILSGILSDINNLQSMAIYDLTDKYLDSTAWNLGYQSGFLLSTILFYELISLILSTAAAEFSQKFPDRQVIQTTIREAAREY